MEALPPSENLSPASPTHDKAIIIGISGCSSSGKTTLSRLLAEVLPNTRIIHEDDFYKPEDDLPMKDGLQDWDSAASLDMPLLTNILSHILEHGSLPQKGPATTEPPPPPKPPSIPPSFLSSLRAHVAVTLSPDQKPYPPIYILDGFLLYGPSVPFLPPLLNVKLFLRTTLALAKARRESRGGYVTAEGFWEDPPGYVDRVVWPNYVDEHRALFVDGDVEGNVDWEVLRQRGIDAMPNGEVGDMRKVLEWAVAVLLERLGGKSRGGDDECNGKGMK
ncbi:MAG: ribosylnicotinamide kinase [Thelocarpon impressellum]|nr:MAG: ribosylnicotinamide kinase [Thelocarpon impressellum]